jgi:ribonuclease BN (tRNA processing enzyme)
VEGADLLITDTTYTDEEYPARVGWGHSCVSQVARLAHKARVKRLCIFHHDPAQSDDDIDRKLLSTREALSRLGGAVEALAPREREELQL